MVATLQSWGAAAVCRVVAASGSSFVLAEPRAGHAPCCDAGIQAATNGSLTKGYFMVRSACLGLAFTLTAGLAHSVHCSLQDGGALITGLHKLHWPAGAGS